MTTVRQQLTTMKDNYKIYLVKSSSYRLEREREKNNIINNIERNKEYNCFSLCCVCNKKTINN